MKKIITLALAMVMVFTMSVTAFAAGEGSITVKNPITDANNQITYEAYRIFDVTPTGNGETDANGKYVGVTYTINSTWSSFFDEEGSKYIVNTNNVEKTLPPIVVNGTTKYINISGGNNAAEVNEFAKTAFEYAQNNRIDAVATSYTGKFTGLDLGYYMIYPKGASVNSDNYTTIVSLTTTNPSQEVVQKAEFPVVKKTEDDASVELGQKINYVVEGKVPNTSGFTTFDYIVKDLMSDGLTYNKDVKVFIDGLEITDFKIVEGEKIGEAAATFAINIPVMNYQDKIGEKIEVKYSATVNSSAVTKIDSNKAVLKYSNDPQDGTKYTENPGSEVKSYSAKISINKVDGKDNTKLTGAKFVLRCKTPGTSVEGQKITAIAGTYYFLDDGKVKWVTPSNPNNADATDMTVVTTENGIASFAGLENGTYELIEVKAPDGYNLMNDPVEVTINGNDSNVASLTVESTVENNKGSMLPETGGIGTTIFYVVGVILMIGAGVMLVTRKKISK